MIRTPRFPLLALIAVLVATLALITERPVAATRLCIPECLHKITELPQSGRGRTCVLIAASHGGGTKEEAVAKSRQALHETMRSWARNNGWAKKRHVTIDAWPTDPMPFVRESVAPHLTVPPDVVDGDVFTTCWEGITLPVGCTSASRVCS